MFIIVLFSFRKPLYVNWDEFSFWGTSVKLVTVNDQMYTTAQIGWGWTATQKPSLIMNGYLYEFFGNYQEWRAIAGMDVLIFSTLSAVISFFDKKQWHKSVAFILFLFIMPFAFSLYGPIITPSSVYMSVLSDIPIGLMFGAVFAVYYRLKDTKNSWWCVCICLAMLTFAKDTALTLSLICAAIICFDILFIQKEHDFYRLKGFKGKTANSALIFLTPVVFFLLWIVYSQVGLDMDISSDLGGSQQVGMVGMVVSGIMQLFGVNPTEKFTVVMGKMYSAYFNVNLTVLGSCFVLTVIVSALVFAAFLCFEDKRDKARCVSFGILSLLGFIAYYIFIGFCYVFVFEDVEAYVLMSYERYMYTYFLGWFSGAVCLMAMAVSRKIQKFYGICRFLIYSLCLLMSVRLSGILTKGYTFLDFDSGLFAQRNLQAEKCLVIQDYVENVNDKIFFIGQGDDGNRWFSYSNQLIPYQLDYSYGGGTFCLPEDDIPQDSLYYIKVTPEQLLEYIDENGCKYVFVEKSDEYLVNGFGHLFSDNLEICNTVQSALYQVKGDKFYLIGGVEA